MFSKNRFIFVWLFILIINTSCKLLSDESVTETIISNGEGIPSIDFVVAQDTTNSTPPKNDDPVVLPPPPLNPGDIDFEEGFSINNDALYTNQDFVDVSFRTLAPFKIKLGRSLNCSDGIWENYVDQKRLALPE